MSFDAHANFAYSAVATAPSPALSGTTLNVSAGTGALFPAAPFNAIVWPTGAFPFGTNSEIIRVTSKGSGDDWTIVRNAELGGTNRAIVVGDQIQNGPTAKVITDIEAAIPSIAGLLSAVNVSAGTTSNNLSALTFNNSNGVTFGLSGSVITATVATNYQSAGAYLTTAALSQDSSKYAGTNGAITGGSITVNTSGVSVNLPAYLTTAMQSDAVTLSNIKVSAGASSALLSALTLSNSNGLAFGLSAGTITGSYTVPTQTNQSAIKGFGVSNTGQTAGNTGLSTGIDWVLAGSGSITMSQSTAVGGPNTVWVQHPAWLTTAMASNRGSDFVQAAAVFNGTNATGTIASGAISVSVAAPVPIGTAVKAVASGGSTGTITRYAPEDHQHAGVAAFAVTNTGNTAGNTRTQVGTLYLAATGAITASQSTAAAGNDTVWLSVAAQTNQSAIKGFGASNTGNTAGNTGLSTGIDWVLAGSNNITISESTSAGGPNTLWVSGPTVGAAQTGISSIIVSDATYTSGMVSFSNQANITIGSSVNGATQFIRLSGNAAQTTQSAIKGFGVSNTGNTAGNTGISTGIDWVMAGSNGITASQSTSAGGPNTVWISGSSITISDAATSGSIARLAFTNLNGITLSLSSGAGGSHTIVGSYTVPTVTNSSWSVSDAATSGTVARLAFTNLNGVTLSLSTGAAGSHTIVGSHNALTSQSTQFMALTLGGNTAGTTTFHATNNASLFFNGGANITLSGNGSTVTIIGATAAPSPVIISGGTSSASLSSIVFSDSNGVSFGLNGSTLTATVSTYSTVGTATSGYPVASANSIGTVTRWAAEDHRHAGVGGIGISTAGNTSGTTGSEVGTYWLQGGQSVTLSQITSNNGSHTLVISGAKQPYNGYFEPYAMTNTALFGPGAGTWYFAPFVADGSISGGRINFLMLNTGTAQLFRDFTEASVVSSSTGAQQQGYTYSLAAAIYSQGSGTNSTRLESAWSNSFSFGWTKSVSVSSSNVSQFKATVAHSISYISDIGSDGAYTLVQYANSTNSQVANSSTASNFADSVFSSGRNIVSASVIYPVGLNTTLSGGNYWLAFAWSTTRSNASTGTRIATALDFSQSSIVGISRLELETLYRNWGSTVTTNRSHIMPYGLYTAAANMVPPTNVALSSDLSSLASAWVPYFNFQLQGLTK